jgi:hypothetical protein
MQFAGPAVRRFSSALVALVLLAACSKDKTSDSSATTATAGAPAAASPASDQDLADVTQYKLSMDKIDKYLQAQRNIAAKAASMTPEQRAALEARGEDESNPNASIDEMAKRIEAEPIMVAAIKDAGLSAREFTMITFSMMQTGMAAAVLKMRPNDNQDSLIRAMQANPDNVKFYNEHEAEITQKTKAIEADMKKAGN